MSRFWTTCLILAVIGVALEISEHRLPKKLTLSDVQGFEKQTTLGRLAMVTVFRTDIRSADYGFFKTGKVTWYAPWADSPVLVVTVVADPISGRWHNLRVESPKEQPTS